MKYIYAPLAVRLKMLREEKGLTQAELAERLHVTRGAIAQYETGKRRPKIDTIQKIAAALEVELADILDFSDLRLGNVLIPDLSDDEQVIQYKDIVHRKGRELDLLMLFRELNNDGQRKVYLYASDLAGNPKYAASSDADPEEQQPT